MRSRNVILCAGCLALVGIGAGTSAAAVEPIPNRLIDYAQFQQIVTTSAVAHENHRLKESEFLSAMGDPNVIILDARSAPMYTLRHIKGAVSLPFTDFTADTLAQVIPRKDAKVMIYCNNN